MDIDWHMSYIVTVRSLKIVFCTVWFSMIGPGLRPCLGLYERGYNYLEEGGEVVEECTFKKMHHTNKAHIYCEHIA